MITKIIDSDKKIVNILNVMNKLNSEITFYFKEDGIVLNCIDGSKSMLLICDINKEYLPYYEFDKESSFVIDTETLLKTFKSMKDNIKISETDTELIFDNESNLKRSIKKYELSKDTLNEPNIEYKNSLKTNCKNFMRDINIISEVNDVVNIVNKKNEMFLICDGLKEKIEIKTDISNKIELDMCFNAEFLNKFSDLKNVSDEIQLFIEQDKPLKFIIDEGIIKIRGFLAPRISE